MGAVCLGREKGAPPPPEVGGFWASSPVAIHHKFSGGCPARKIMGLPEPDYDANGQFSYLCVDAGTPETGALVDYGKGAVLKAGNKEVVIYTGKKQFTGGIKEFAEDEWTLPDGSEPFKITDKEYTTYEGKQVMVAMKVDGQRVERLVILQAMLGEPAVQMPLAVIYSEFGDQAPMVFKAVLDSEEEVRKMYGPSALEGAEADHVAKMAHPDEADHFGGLKGAEDGKKHVLVKRVSTKKL